MSSSILVTGANRGIGLGLVRQFLQLPGVQNIFATARNPDASTELSAIKDPRLHILKLDVDNDESIKQVYQKVESVVGDKGLDILVNNAGLWENYYADKCNRESFNKSINVNCTSPLIVTQTFVPLLERGGEGKVANISSFLASLSKTAEGGGERGSMAYKTSKTALNMVGRVLCHDLAPKNIIITQFCPGWVQTDMGGEGAILTVDESTSVLAKSIVSLKKEHTGGFYNRDLSVIPF